MKKIRILVVIFSLVLFALVTTSCKGCKRCNDEVEIEAVSIVNETVPSSIKTTEVLSIIGNIQIEVKTSDDNVTKVNISKDMISEADLAKLNVEGTHTITVNYEGYQVPLTLVIVKPTDGGNNDDPEAIEYSVLVKDIAGKPLSEFYVIFYLGDKLIDEGYTSASGTFKTSQLPNKYEVIIEGRDGYYLNQETFETDLIGTQIVVECQIDKLVGIEADPTHMYQLGDVMYDFTIVDTEKNSLNLYTLLETYDLVMLNFWYTTCSACYYEFPYMVEAYESSFKDASGNDVKYSDKVAIIAVNPGFAGDGDTIDEIIAFQEQMGLTFNVALDYDADKTNITLEPALTTMFGINAYPTSVFIDRYGLIADVEVGSITATDKWQQTFDKYIGDNYVPVYTGEVEEDAFIEPDIEQPDSSLLEDAACGTNYDNKSFTTTFTPETNGEDAKYSWPWINDTYKDLSCIRPSNKDQNPSYSIVYFDVDLKKDQVLAFDYFASTEEYDVLYVIVDGNIATQISGQSRDWETSYAYVSLKDAEYEFVLCYMKDGSYSQGDDSVFIRNIRIVETKDIDKETYIFREASNGVINEFTMSYQEYITPVYNEEDGYYHVNDASGPLLLVDLLSGSHWNTSTLYEISLEGKCIGNDGVDYNALIEKYAIYSSNSLIGYTPVTKELADALKQIVKALGAEEAQTNINQWLELCVYYSTYGTGGKELSIEQIGLIGVAADKPIMFEGDGITEPAKAEGVFDRIILPRGLIFGFTPTVSGVYSFYSTEETLETAGWICDENAVAIAETEFGLRLFAEQIANGETVDLNFIAYVYLEAGETYLFRAAFYDPFEYSTISVEMKYVADSIELFTTASPGFYTSSDDEMSDIISGNYVDVEIGDDGYYHVIGSLAKDDLLYCDITYVTNVFSASGKTLLDVLNAKGFDFSKDSFGSAVFDEEGYLRVSEVDEEYNVIRYYVCVDKEGNEYYVETIGEGEYTEANGYTYIKLTEEEMAQTPFKDNTEYVREYIKTHMVTDKESELYGCVKVDEQFGKVLQELMDKYSFEGVDYSWLKLCYYYRYVGPTASE